MKSQNEISEFSNQEIIALAEALEWPEYREDVQQKTAVAIQCMRRYGASVLTRGQRVILDMQSPLEYNAALDDCQRKISATLQELQLVLDDLADKRYEEAKELPMRHHCIKNRGEWIRANIWDLERLLENIERDIVHISAQPPIQSQSAEEYLNQEILREKYYVQLKTWEGIHEDIRIDIAQALGSETSYISEEEKICISVQKILEDDLSNLTDEQECQRAAYILGIVLQKRHNLFKSFMVKPVPTLVPQMIVGVENPLSASAFAAMQYLYSGLSNLWEAASYRRPEVNAERVLSTYYNIDRSSVITALADAGIKGQPEDILKV